MRFASTHINPIMRTELQDGDALRGRPNEERAC
jgi:hypothetical protein